MLRTSPSQKDKSIKDSTDISYKDCEYYDLVREWTIRDNFRFPVPLTINDNLGVGVGVIPERFHLINVIPSMNTSLYYLLSQYNPWLDCEMTREKRAFLKPKEGEICYTVYCEGIASSNSGSGSASISISGSGSSRSSSTSTSTFFRSETVMDIVNLYLWPLLHSRAEEVIACRTFADWRRLFTRTISLAFPDYEYWRSQATDPFISGSDKRRTACILKHMTPARVLYLLTTSAGFWPYGASASASSSSSSSSRLRNATSGLCSIKSKIKEYNDKTEIDWLVGADFLRKMKRVHMYFTTSVAHASPLTTTLLHIDSDSE